MYRVVLRPVDNDHPVVAIPLREGNYLVGRGGGCDIVINDNSVSRQHARIMLNGSVLSITDLDSRNGTFVDEQQVRRCSQVQMGQVIRFGSAPFRLALQSNESLAYIDEDDETVKRTNGDSFDDSIRLTPTQKRVHDLLLDGCSEAEAAARLALSVNTVHTHVRAIYAHFGVHTRAELLAQCLRAIRKN